MKTLRARTARLYQKGIYIMAGVQTFTTSRQTTGMLIEFLQEILCSTETEASIDIVYIFADDGCDAMFTVNAVVARADKLPKARECNAPGVVNFCQGLLQSLQGIGLWSFQGPFFNFFWYDKTHLDQRVNQRVNIVSTNE